MKRTLSRNPTIVYSMGFFHAFVLIVPVFVPLAQGYGLSMAEILQTQALYALTIACFEVPSGYVADIWGRKRAVLLGSAVNAGGFLWLINADGFADFLVYEVLLGVGISLVSGADLALLYDSEKTLEARGESRGSSSRALSRLIAIEAGASGIAGLGAALLLVFTDLHGLVLAQAVFSLMPLILGLGLVETERPVLTQGHGANTRAIVGLILGGRPVVLWTTIAIAVFGLLALYAFWIYQKYWELQGIPVEQFGYVWAFFALAVSAAARYASHLEARFGWRALLLVTAILPVIGLAGMAIFGGWVGVLFGFALQISRGMSLTLFYDALNRRIPNDFRATVNSLVSLAVRSLFIVTGPLLGWALDNLGMHLTLLGLLLLFAPLLVVVTLGLVGRIRREQAPALPAPAGP